MTFDDVTLETNQAALPGLFPVDAARLVYRKGYRYLQILVSRPSATGPLRNDGKVGDAMYVDRA